MKKKAKDIQKGDQICLKEAAGFYEVEASLSNAIMINFDGQPIWIPLSLIEVESSFLGAESLDRIFYLKALPEWFVNEKYIY